MILRYDLSHCYCQLKRYGFPQSLVTTSKIMKNRNIIDARCGKCVRFCDATTEVPGFRDRVDLC